MTLTEFLLARIAEDEAVAQAAKGDFTVSADWPAAKISLHIDRWYPPRVLAECETKRRIVAAAPWADNGGHAALKDLPGRWILRLLALPYADHPDYLPEWRPDPVNAENLPTR